MLVYTLFLSKIAISDTEFKISANSSCYWRVKNGPHNIVKKEQFLLVCEMF